MEKLVIFRMFLCFPLAGVLVPDAMVVLSGTSLNIPTVHLAVELALIILISLCSAVIYYKKRNRNSPGNETSFS
jgi:uncharacterized membrane protein